MEINIKQGEKITIELTGRLDTNSSQEFEERLEKEQIKGFDVILDFIKLDYISSAGLRSLLALKHKLNDEGKDLEIININPIVKEVFKVTGFINVLNIK